MTFYLISKNSNLFFWIFGYPFSFHLVLVWVQLFESLYIKYSFLLFQGVHVAINVINSDAVEPTHVPHYKTQRIIKLATSGFFCFWPIEQTWALSRPPFKALGIRQHSTLTLAVSFVTPSTGFCAVQTGYHT